MSYKIGILLPSTTNKREWNTVKETHLYNIFLKSFLTTYTQGHKYVIYLIVDNDDKVFSKKSEIDFLHKFINVMNDVTLNIVYSDNIPKGYVTHMWNKVFQIAYDDGCHYFYQCGDDVEFLDTMWVDSCIKMLIRNNNIGVSGPIDWGRRLWEISNNSTQKFLLTQTFVSRKHMELFGFYFPPEIKNWFCDDWITNIYFETKLLYPIQKRVFNKGGAPRYDPIGKKENNEWAKMTKLCRILVNKHKDKLIQNLKDKKNIGDMFKNIKM